MFPNFMRLVVLFILCFFGLCSTASACFMPPDHMYKSVKDTIDDTEWIARVKGVSWEDINEDGSSYTAAKMNVIEYLKGDGPDQILISPVRSNGAHGDGAGPNEGNSAGHADTSFWLYGGRNANDPDCKIHPSMLVDGSEYIVFGPQDYNYGYENISGDNDLWLTFIKDYLKNEDTPLPFPGSFEYYIKDAAAIVRFKSDWNKTGAIWTQEILSGKKLDYAALLYPSPNAYFSEMVNPNCKDYNGSAKNPESIEQIVVFERLPKEKIRISQSLECTGADYDGYGTITANGIFSRKGHATFTFRTTDNGWVRPFQSRYGEDFLPDAFDISDIRQMLKAK